MPYIILTVPVGRSMSQPEVPNQNRESGPPRTVAETLLSASVVEAIPDAVAAVNQQGVIIQVNSQTEKLFGYTRSELIGQRIEMLVPERQRPQHDQHRDQFHRQPKIRRMGSGLDFPAGGGMGPRSRWRSA